MSPLTLPEATASGLLAQKVRRRDVLAAFALAMAAGSAAGESGPAVEDTLARAKAAGSVAGQRWVGPEGTYFAYPHNNGFLPDAQRPVIARRDGQAVAYSEWDFRTGALRLIARTAQRNMYYDIAERTGRLFFADSGRQVASVDARGGAAAMEAAPLGPSQVVEGLLSVNRAGDKVLYAVDTLDAGRAQATRFFELDVATGTSAPVFGMPFFADHQQYCPHDERWIGFAHEGNISTTLDRVWGLHRVAGAQPRRLWDETAAQGTLIVGHERWAFHRAGALVVAFPASTGRPRGLYFVDAAAGRAELVSASDYDWHCNLSRDGRWAVVDTTVSHGAMREPDGRVISDVVLVDMRRGRRYWVARSHAAAHHPWHPHPHFTPDGQYIIYNDDQHDGAGSAGRVVVVQVAYPA